MLKKKLKERLPERRNPGDPAPEFCAPGSIEQQLDMCEEGSLRGDEILHSHGRNSTEADGVDKLMNLNYSMDMSEDDREGDEMSGDEHSSGLQGDET